jgi:hypothetical protein
VDLSKKQYIVLSSAEKSVSSGEAKRTVTNQVLGFF